MNRRTPFYGAGHNPLVLHYVIAGVGLVSEGCSACPAAIADRVLDGRGSE